jgi:hypothetical protein
MSGDLFEATVLKTSRICLNLTVRKPMQIGKDTLYNIPTKIQIKQGQISYFLKSSNIFDNIFNFVFKNKNKQYSSQSLPMTRSSLLASSPRKVWLPFFAIHRKFCDQRLLSSPERDPVGYMSHSKLHHNSMDRHNQWSCNDHCCKQKN